MKKLLQMAGCGMLWMASLGTLSLGAAERPNFVVILCDDLGWGDLGCFGHPQIQTPNLDQLAKDGMRLTSFYSAAPVCSPSRVGLMTGRNPNRAGVYDWIPHLDERGQSGQQNRASVHLRKEEVTLPQLLKQAGYATALSGKWHCNAEFNSSAQPQPNDAGFDHWFATQNNAAPSHENPVNFVRNGEEVGPLQGYSCQLAAREVIGWLEHRKEPEQPFFVYLAFHEPHEPVASPPELVSKYRGKARDEDEAQYFANVENMDAAVGEVLKALERLKLAENTVVIFSSDNGPETHNRYPKANRSYGSPGPLRGMKLWTNEAGFRVPGMVRWPGKIKAGQVSDVPVSSLDFLPTFVSLAGSAVPEGLALDGVDLKGFFSGASNLPPSRPLLWIYFNSVNEQRVAMRDGEWKLLARLNGGELPKFSNITESNVAKVREAKLTDFSLYHISEDQAETKDLSSTETEKLKELREKMETAYQEMVGSMHVWPVNDKGRAVEAR